MAVPLTRHFATLAKFFASGEQTETRSISCVRLDLDSWRMAILSDEGGFNA